MNWLITEPNPGPRRRNLLIYSSCHAWGILRYLNQHRPDIRAQYNVSAILIHLAAEDPGARNSPEFIRAVHEADFLLHHPLATEKWEGMRPDEIGLKNSCVAVTMESPQASCFWPVVHGPLLGELPVRTLLGKGAEETEIIRLFDSGEMKCYFADRFTSDMARMRERDARSDLKAAEFIANHFRNTKMFFTENHPTMPVLGWMTDQFLARLGHPSQGEEAALALPLDTMEGWNHFPETEYEWEHYGLDYPRKYESYMGGKDHYHRIIKVLCESKLAGGRIASKVRE